MGHRINFSDVSILFHGVPDANIVYEDNYTVRAVVSLRKTGFKGEIILSTWNDLHIPSAIHNLFDRVVTSDDPGPTYISSSAIHNLNRHIQSTRVGLEACAFPFVAVVRTDCTFELDKLIRKYLKFLKLAKNTPDYGMNLPFAIISKGTKLEVSPFTKCFQSFNFHSCDFLYFGLKSDLMRFFSCSLSNDGKRDSHGYVNFFIDNYMKRISGFAYDIPFRQQFIAEAYPVCMLINSYCDDQIKTSWSEDPHERDLSKKWHASNIILINPESINFIWLKKPYLWQSFPAGCFARYTEQRWLVLQSHNVCFNGFLDLCYRIKWTLFDLLALNAKIFMIILLKFNKILRKINNV